jgi:hypothetical protein
VSLKRGLRSPLCPWHLWALGHRPGTPRSLPHTGPACVLPAPCCPLRSHRWHAHCATSQLRWQLKGQGQVSGEWLGGAGGRARQLWGQDRTPTLNLLCPDPTDGSSDQLALLVLTGAPQLWVGGRQREAGLWSPGLHLPCPHPLPWPGPHQSGQLLHVIHGLQPPRQPCQGCPLLGLSLLRTGETF